MKIKNLPRSIVLFVLIISLLPVGSVLALAATSLPPVDMFQLPWEQGLSWVSLDGFDNGFKRPLGSPHNYLNGGAIDFAPRVNMRVGEDTSNFWVTAAAGGTVVEISACHMKINHGNGWISEYQHLANIQVGLGQAVYRNQRLAVIADGLGQKFCPPALEPDIPHLHFSLRPTMRGVTFAGWQVGYIPYLNKTTFTKNGEVLTSYQPIPNNPGLQIVLRDPITWDTVYIGNVDASRYERWPFGLIETNKFTLSVTPTTSGLVPLLLLLDANGNEVTRGIGVLTSTQPAGNYFVQVQPQSGSGFYNLLLTRDSMPDPDVPSSSTDVSSPNIDVGESVIVSVSLNNVPAEGYTSAEFTCTYDPIMIEVSNITTTDLFGTDPAVAIQGPQNGSFIVAIAGSHGNKATTSGVAFTFNAKGIQAGQTTIGCNARVSLGNGQLADLPSTGAVITILGITSTPTVTPTPTIPSHTATPTPPYDPWLTFTNQTYGFQFKYPQEGMIVSEANDTFARINLPYMPGTNLTAKYLEVIVAENINPCQSPLATQSILETSEMVTINDISFLKQTGQDGTAGHINTWIAYSTFRDTACVSLDFILRAVNPGVYSTPPPLYDEAAESAVFGQMVSTFTWLESQSNGVLVGQVLASKPVTINLYRSDSSIAATVTANTDGTFTLTAPAGTYTAVASSNGFLNAQASVTLTNGATTTLTAIILPAGDIDGNNIIDQFDAITIGMNYNTAVPSVADLNGDGIINVLDLELLAGNYRKAGPIVWQ